MIKELSIYFIIGGLLIVGHSFLQEALQDESFESYGLMAQVFLFLLFVKGHVLTLFLAKKMKVLVGQVFLIFSVVKFLFGGIFVFGLTKMGDHPLSKRYLAIFMFSYFTYLIAEVFVLLKRLQQEDVPTSSNPEEQNQNQI